MGVGRTASALWAMMVKRESCFGKRQILGTFPLPLNPRAWHVPRGGISLQAKKMCFEIMKAEEQQNLLFVLF